MSIAGRPDCCKAVTTNELRLLPLLGHRPKVGDTAYTQGNLLRAAEVRGGARVVF